MALADRSLRSDARRNREMILDAASELFAVGGDGVQMDDIAARAGLGVGTLYRHFADKQALRAAIIARRFDAVTQLAETASGIEDPLVAFETLLYGYLESAESDAAFRVSILGSETPAWETIAAQKRAFNRVVAAVVERAVRAGVLRDDFTTADFVLITRGAMANMDVDTGWRRFLALQLEGIAAPSR
ncbi:TetR/AcrR family transcriptional regulator [Leifsonia sp. AG29]|uniref:TetR/AcrR family transcriptional regulator n=1 Tax=Leifsonia sp. AG29 TaxID=2598860 RepID=UPI00131B7FB6|nr:TetR/AcrR family transcriptional regulator [Leifsonia sp. AG29]